MLLEEYATYTPTHTHTHTHTHTGAWTLTTLDNGVISKEFWTTVDAADDLSVLF